MKWTVLESTYLHKVPWLTTRKDKCQLPNGKMVEAFYVHEYPEWVNVFALTDEQQVVMVKQYRHGVERVDFELPGGVAEEGENMQEAAERELMEETGYACDSIEYMGKVSANPSTTNNYAHMYLATGAKKIAEQNLDEGEDVEVVLMTIDEVVALVKENKIIQSLHVSNILYALARLGKLTY